MESTPTLRDLFEEALKLPPDARARLLAGCADPSMRAELERLLTADAEEGEWLAAGDAASAAQTIGETEDAEPLPPGSRIGPFELLEVLGEGGSSTVFRGCREVEGVRQFVAVKLLARGLYTAEARRRFHHEREALARLRHPGIARLIEGGVADNGLAYIALELIDGVPITRYAQDKNLSERQRLMLFLQVCRAIESAHRALIVHRDLKPSNVLVTPEGEVKLLDFGIAKLLDNTEDATRTRHQALTPAYAAPEQFTAGAITTATDVYALGGLLCELLTGERTAQTHAPHTVADKSSANAKHAPLCGDLANIVAKATAQQPERRYGSASVLADDIERYLEQRPVSAHPPSRWYRAGKFVARHRGGVAVTAALLLAIFASLSIALWQAHVARREAERAEAIRDFVVGLLEETSPDVAADKRPDVPTLVYTAAKGLPHELRDQPELHAQLLYTLGNVLRDMGDYPHSETLLRDADASAAGLPSNSMVRIESRLGLVRTLVRRGKYDEAAAAIEPLLGIPADQLPEDDPRPELLKVAMVIADGRNERALAISRGREMLKEYRAACRAGRLCDELGHATHDLASVMLDADLIAEARPLADEALARKQHDATPMSLANTVELQSKISLYRGDLDAAEADARKAGELVDSLGDSLHRKPLEPWAQRIDVLLAKEDAEQVAPLLDTLMAQRRSRSAPPCRMADSEIQQARMYLLLDQPGQAVSTSARAAKDSAFCQDPTNVTAAMARLVHGRALVMSGDLAGARVEYAKVSGLTASVHARSPLSWPFYLVESMRLANALGHAGDAARDARLLIAALDRAESLPSHPWRLEAQLLLATTSPGEAAKIHTPAFGAALAGTRAWPIGARLSRQRAALEATR